MSDDRLMIRWKDLVNAAYRHVLHSSHHKCQLLSWLKSRGRTKAEKRSEEGAVSLAQRERQRESKEQHRGNQRGRGLEKEGEARRTSPTDEE